jgi:hypothetical protein
MRDPNAKTFINLEMIKEMKERKLKPMEAASVNWQGLKDFLGPAAKPVPKIPELMVTMCPSFPHFYRFANDQRVDGVRFNSAMITLPELDNELGILAKRPPKSPVYYDVKGRQMRILKVETENQNLVLTINHPIQVDTPTVVLFKAGADVAMLDHIETTDEGQRLVFDGGPTYKLVAGESLHIRDKSFKNLRGSTKEDNVFTQLEQEKIKKVKAAGINRFFLSYVENQYDVDLFQEMVGKDAEIWLKIESIEGLKYVQNTFKKRDNLVLVAARGDLFVELDQPHHMIQALRLIINKDPKASVGSRLLLSIVNSPVPSCADLLEMEWMYSIGYRRMMLCDELCLKENLLASAVAVFDGVKKDL